MKKVILGTEMKKVDRFAIDTLGIPSIVLMERAAYGVFEEIRYLCNKKEEILIISGVGNNGADGLAIARMLEIDGYKVDTFVVGSREKATREFKIQENINQNIGVNLLEELEEKEYKIVVDAIFGIGLKRDLIGEYVEVVNRINEMHSTVISVDVPSGLCSDTGVVRGIAVKANITITFGIDKVGLLTSNSLKYTGTIIVKEIGFPKEAYEQASNRFHVYEKTDLKLIPARERDSNKGTYGKILVVAGSEGMSGAAYLSSMAAYRMGTGLVEIFTEEKNREILQKMIPEATMKNYDVDSLEPEKIANAAKGAGVIILGPGIGVSENSEMLVTEVLKSKKPVVVDADALNIISANHEITKLYHDKVIITPHIGEMSRLIKKEVDVIKKECIKECESYSNKYGVICVLKDARTIISNGKESMINLSGNPGMSTAGTGDVLTGIIAALISLGLNCFRAATLGVYLHGLAGDIMSETLSEHSLMASDIIQGIKYLTGDDKHEF